MRARLRKLLLVGTLAGVVGFLVLDGTPRLPEVASAKADGPVPRPGESLRLPERGGLASPRGELFGAAPPPRKPAPSVVPAASAPIAPPVPYRFAGKIRRGTEEQILLSKGESVFPVKVGDTLDGMYRVEFIGAEHIELLYLPLGTRDQIRISSALEPGRAPATATPSPPAGFSAAVR